MKKDIHPANHRPVLFQDISTGTQFLVNSTVSTDETGTYEADKKEYPLVIVEISSASHPFYTGQERTMDSAGRVDKFNRRKQASTSN